MYQVFETHYGRPMIKNGPMSGCRDFATYRHTDIARVRSKAKAIALANDHPIHCRVNIADTCQTIHDNGKDNGKLD